VAGATVRHQSPFSNLDIPIASQSLSRELIEYWVLPLYNFNLWNDGNAFAAAAQPLLADVSPDIVLMLLHEFDWRPRIVGAYLAAITNWKQFDDHIGRLLLRSDVCYAGTGYAIALTRFNTDASKAALHQYLDYYLNQPNLWFDQDAVMAALGYLDNENGTDERARHIAVWNTFIGNKPNWGLEHSDELFAQRMATIHLAAQRSGSHDITTA
jgi:hypothetical protein